METPRRAADNAHRPEEGLASDWHLVHLGSRAVGGAALVIVEATAVTRDGRISPADLGIWNDEQTDPLARIARFVHSQGAVAGIQELEKLYQTAVVG